MADEKKIIIDEDWKTQVQREKEAAKQPAPSPAEEPAAAPVAAPSAPADSDQDPRMPPASFEMLVTTLATEALMALGQIPHPVTGDIALRTNQAKYLIDTIDVLRDKTKNNLTPNEQKLIEAVLHQARMVFIAVTNEHASA
jgi:3-oxoacyl-ACP reductase-like protein